MISTAEWKFASLKKLLNPSRRGYFLYLIIIVSATALSFSKSIFFAKKLIPEEFGVYSLVLTSYAFILYLGSFGASEYMFKLGAREFTIGDKRHILRIRTNALYYGFIATTVLSLGAILLASVFLKSILSVVLMSALIAIPAICYNIFDAYYRSSRMYLWFSSMLFVKSTLILLISAFSIEKFGLFAAIGAEIAGFVIVFLSLFLWDLSSFKVVDINGLRDELTLMSKHGLPTILVNMTRNVSLMFERYFISFAMGLASFGKYSFVMIIYLSSIMGGGILVNILGQRWLSIYATNVSPSFLLKDIGKFSVSLVVLSVLAYPIFSFGFPIVLKGFFTSYDSPEVVTMAHIVYWASVAYLVVSFLDWFFIATSKERITLLISIATLAALIVMFVGCFYYKLGIVYYVLSFLLSRALVLFLMLLAVAREVTQDQHT